MIPKSKPRGRPRAFDRNVALEAAMLVFWQKGFTAASMSDLCNAMGIGSPSLYAAFGSKENLYAEAIAHYVTIGAPKIWAPLQNASTAREGIAALLQASAENLAKPDHPPGCMLVLSDAANTESAAVCKFLTTERTRSLEILQNRFLRGITDGDLPANTDVPALARFYLTVQQGMSIQARDGASPQELQTIAHQAMAAWPIR